jgi:hypothetical protein
MRAVLLVGVVLLSALCWQQLSRLSWHVLAASCPYGVLGLEPKVHPWEAVRDRCREASSALAREEQRVRGDFHGGATVDTEPIQLATHRVTEACQQIELNPLEALEMCGITRLDYALRLGCMS